MWAAAALPQPATSATSIANMSAHANPALVLEGGSDDSVGDLCRFGIVTVSDRASTGVYDDLSGPAILQFFHEAIKSK